MTSPTASRTGPTTPADLHGARVALTGRLATLSRRRAADLLQENGGELVERVNRQTTHLVVGMNGWPLMPDGAMSTKLQRAEELNRSGAGCLIISEASFRERLGLDPTTDFVKSYTAEQVCRMAAVPAETLRHWELLSLLRPVAGRYDFQDVVSLRTLTELVARGVRPERIHRSLRGLAVVFDISRPLAQLRIVAENADTLLAELGDARVAPDGQLLLNFDGAVYADEARVVPLADPSGNAEELLDRGLWLEEQRRFAEAVETYRAAARRNPALADAHFNLGNALRQLGEADEALRSYREALRQDQGLACAWYNIADIQQECGALEAACESLRRAVELAPAYADAHFNLALSLEQLGRRAAARPHWSRYVQLDPHSEWADVARGYLEIR